MALPSTGGTYSEILQPGLNPTAVRKAIVTDVLIRDYHGAMTDLSDPAVGLNDDGVFTPFAEDGELRDDLLITASGANLGFHHIGLLTEDGLTYTPEVNVEDTMAAQSRRKVRADITSESDRVKFVAEESTPLIDALMDDVPLTALQDIGKIGYVAVKPAYGNIVERQIILLMFDGNEYAAKILPRCSRTDVGETNWNKSNPDVMDVTYDALICPYAGYPVATAREGQGWRAKGGYPDFGLVAPVATQTGSTSATVAFAVPTGVGDPWSYTVEKSTTPFTSWTAATVGSTSGTSTVTLGITGLTTATGYKFRVTAEGSNGLSSVSQVSNTATTS